MMMKITLNRPAPRPENFADVDEFFTAFAEWEKANLKRKSKKGFTFYIHKAGKQKTYGEKAIKLWQKQEDKAKGETKVEGKPKSQNNNIALEAYGSLNGSQGINSSLLNPTIKMSPEAESSHNSLQKLFSKTKTLEKPIKVHRSISLHGLKLDRYLAGMKKGLSSGSTVILPGYQSTSIGGASRPGNLELIIEANKGIDMKGNARFEAEREFLINHNSKFQVVGVEVDQDGKSIVRLKQNDKAKGGFSVNTVPYLGEKDGVEYDATPTGTGSWEISTNGKSLGHVDAPDGPSAVKKFKPTSKPEQTFKKAIWENPNKPHLPVEVSNEVVTGPSGKKYRKTKEGVGVPAEEIREADSPAEWSYENATKQIENNRDEYRHLLNEIEKNKLQDQYPEVYADTKKALEVAESLLAKNVQKIPQGELAKLAKKVEPKKVDEAAKMKVGKEKKKPAKKEPEMIDESLLKAVVSPSGSLEFTDHPDYQLYRQSVDKARNAVIDRISRISDRFLQFADPTGDLGIEGSRVPASTVIEGFLNDAIRGKKLPNKGVFGDEAGSLIKIGNQAESHNVTAKVKQRAKKLAKELGTPMIPVLAMNDADIPVGWALVQSPVSFPKGKDSFNTIPANAISSHKLNMHFDDMELPQDYKNGMMLDFDNDVDHGTWFLAKKHILSEKQTKSL